MLCFCLCSLLNFFFFPLNLCFFANVFHYRISISQPCFSRERIYKNYGVVGPASALLSSLSHKLKGGYACLHDGPFLMNGAFKKEVLVHFSHFHLIPLRLKFNILFKLDILG